MAAGDVTLERGPDPVGSVFEYEGTLEAAAAGTDVEILTGTIIGCQLTCQEAAEVAASAYPNTTDGSTVSNGHVFVRHSGTGTATFMFRITAV